jgi:hypothetical protein
MILSVPYDHREHCHSGKSCGKYGMKTILILKNHGQKKRVIDAIALRWTKAGHRVITHYGTENLPEVDIVILHVDTTYLPDEYLRRLRRYPVVVNRRAVNISKTEYSKNIVTEKDDYAGAVIVKTKANYGGLPDAWYQDPSLMGRLCVRLRILSQRNHGWENCSELDPFNYPILNNKKEVPEGVWKNRNLMVQQFLPEREEDLFFVRYWIFFGDQGWARRFGSKKPIVKFRTRVTAEKDIPLPDELVEMRNRLGLDYGRIDYVQHEGKTMILDVNRALGGAKHNLDKFEVELNSLARGIDRFAEQCNTKGKPNGG